MNCPVCNVPLLLSERQGVEIDYCPQCRGIWLDRGELDKILERSVQPANNRPVSSPAENRYDYERDYKHHDDHHHEKHDHYGQHKRRSFLHDLFD
ncbi:MAG: zf-TFIIB domain-containing protein [Smithella sp.]